MGLLIKTVKKNTQFDCILVSFNIFLEQERNERDRYRRRLRRQVAEVGSEPDLRVLATVPVGMYLLMYDKG